MQFPAERNTMLDETTRVYSADALWTGDEGSLIAGGTVVVKGTTIAWLGEASALPAEYAGAETTHLPGATILPGLIESHAHLSYDGQAGTKKRSFSRSDPALVAVMLGSARELLSVGVTTVRDLGARDNLSVEARDIIAQGIARGPRMIVAGAQITTTGGHTWQNHGTADSPDELRKLVRSQHKAGVDLIKVNATGGFMTAGSAPWFAQFSSEEFAVIVNEAHRLNKKVAAHAHGVEGIRRALAAGVDSIEHCTFVAGEGLIEPDLDLIDALAAAGTYVCATATFSLPAMMRANPSFVPPVALMRERGVRLIAGNDAGVDGVPHSAYVGGLETLLLFGLSPEEVLVAATSRAAEALGVGHIAGRLAVGMSADLIAVTGDPLSSIGAIRDLELVVARGERFVPDRVFVPDPDADVLAFESQSAITIAEGEFV
jgi:imidazolonepropionase-like amidohydrolase